jgi:hypothetical protein
MASRRYFAGWGRPAAPTNTPRADRWCIRDNIDVLALIAFATDPARTHMAPIFDRTLEGIQLAAQADGYVMDRYWLPWSGPVKPEGKNGDTSHSRTDSIGHTVRDGRGGTIIVITLAQIHRDPILSRITSTTGNALDLRRASM